MSTSKNSVHLVGFAGRDPEVRELGNNQKVARVSIAINESFRNGRGELVEQTQWHNLVLWNKQADKAQELVHKGTEFSVDGRLSSGSYIAKDGAKRYVTEVIVNDLQVVEKPVAAE